LTLLIIRLTLPVIRLTLRVNPLTLLVVRLTLPVIRLTLRVVVRGLTLLAGHAWEGVTPASARSNLGGTQLARFRANADQTV
jgi:hypothetical protein